MFNKVFIFGNKNGFNSWIIFWVVCKCKLLIKERKFRLDVMNLGVNKGFLIVRLYLKFMFLLFVDIVIYFCE